MAATKRDSCALCGEKFGEYGKDNFKRSRFDQSDICTLCQVYDSPQMQRSRREDQYYARRIGR